MRNPSAIQRYSIHYLIIGLGALAVTITAVVYLWPERRLEAPAELFQKVVESTDQQRQIAAATDLVAQGEVARVEIRAALAASHNSPPEVQAKLLQGAMKTRDWRSLPEIFRAMQHEDPIVRGRAGAAAREIMGVDFYFRANDPPEQRAQILETIREEYQQSIHRYEQFYSDQPE